MKSSKKQIVKLLKSLRKIIKPTTEFIKKLKRRLFAIVKNYNAHCLF